MRQLNVRTRGILYSPSLKKGGIRVFSDGRMMISFSSFHERLGTMILYGKRWEI